LRVWAAWLVGFICGLEAIGCTIIVKNAWDFGRDDLDYSSGAEENGLWALSGFGFHHLFLSIKSVIFVELKAVYDNVNH